MKLPSLSDPSRPKYWRQETSGILEPVIQKILQDGDWILTEREIQILSLYFQQWVDSPVWDQNPHETERSKEELQSLRQSARALKTTGDVNDWIARAISEGMDPL